MTRVQVAAAVLALTALSFFQFPGHTWLQSDTQIYAPILEHLRDRDVLANEMLVQRPHVSFTVYDEIANGLRASGMGLREALGAVQFVTRAAGILGVYLMAAGMGASAPAALLAASILALGGTIIGPSVLIFEYEPVPRGFAVPLLLLAMGLLAHGRDLAAGAAGAAAFLFHPPTIYPFWGVYFLMTLWPSKPDVMRRRITGLWPLLAAAVLLLLASRMQAGAGDTQAFFTRLDPLMEKLQRMRATYVYPSMWWPRYWPHYAILGIAIAVAYRRLRPAIFPDLRWFVVGMPAVGFLSVPLTAYLLEQRKWAILPQVQPMRAVLFITVFAMLLAVVAASKARERRRWVEAFVWLAMAYAIPVTVRLDALPTWTAALVVAGLAAAATASLQWGRWAPAAVALAGFFAAPLGGVQNFPRLHTQELDGLSAWASANTPKDAVFLFPRAGRDLAPGVFRANSRRALYVDWKGGGQVNYLPELGELWWRRWQQVMLDPDPARDWDLYRKMGIGYIVLSPADPAPGAPAYRNGGYAVYPVRP